MRHLTIMAAATSIALVAPTSPLAAKERPVWSVSVIADPITGRRSCMVAAFDRAMGMAFTRVGMMYPVVEMNSELGLLVGVSAGGRFRVPTGDIVWRVDDLPYRELRSADNPVAGQPGAPADVVSQTTQYAMALARAGAATSTMASGDTAREMLAEMRRGKGLQFRQAFAVGSYGLPEQKAQETGQLTKKGLRPFPLDASFHAGLAACGISERPADPETQP